MEAQTIINIFLIVGIFLVWIILSEIRASLRSLCSEVKETKKFVSGDHDVLNRGRGAFAGIMSLSAFVSAAVAWFANKFF